MVDRDLRHRYITTDHLDIVVEIKFPKESVNDVGTVEIDPAGRIGHDTFDSRIVAGTAGNAYLGTVFASPLVTDNSRTTQGALIDRCQIDRCRPIEHYVHITSTGRGQSCLYGKEHQQECP